MTDGISTFKTVVEILMAVTLAGFQHNITDANRAHLSVLNFLIRYLTNCIETNAEVRSSLPPKHELICKHGVSHITSPLRHANTDK